MSKDFLLNKDHDIDLVNYDLAFTTPEELTVQKLKQALLLFKGEWFLNTNAGVPYYEDILGKGKPLANIETIFIRAIQGVEEVTEILNFNMEFDSAKRNLSVAFTVRDNQDNVLNLDLEL